MSADKSNSLPLRVDVLESNVDLKGMSVIEIARIAYTGGDLDGPDESPAQCPGLDFNSFPLFRVDLNSSATNSSKASACTESLKAGRIARTTFSAFTSIPATLQIITPFIIKAMRTARSSISSAIVLVLRGKTRRSAESRGARKP